MASSRPRTTQRKYKATTKHGEKQILLYITIHSVDDALEKMCALLEQLKLPVRLPPSQTPRSTSTTTNTTNNTTYDSTNTGTDSKTTVETRGSLAPHEYIISALPNDVGILILRQLAGNHEVALVSSAWCNYWRSIMVHHLVIKGIPNVKLSDLIKYSSLETLVLKCRTTIYNDVNFNTTFAVPTIELEDVDLGNFVNLRGKKIVITKQNEGYIVKGSLENKKIDLYEKSLLINNSDLEILQLNVPSITYGNKCLEQLRKLLDITEEEEEEEDSTIKKAENAN